MFGSDKKVYDASDDKITWIPDDSPTKVIDAHDWKELSKINHDHKRLFGKSSKPRSNEPGMFDLLAAGHEEDNLGDYLKNKRHLA